MAASCAGDDSATTDDLDDIFAEAASQSTNDGGTGDGDDEESSSDGGGTSEFMTVYGIPPFGSPSIDPGFGAFTETDNEFVNTKWVSFMMTGTSKPDVVNYYSDMFTADGYDVSSTELGTSTALTFGMADEPDLTGLVQVGYSGADEMELIVTQELTMRKVTAGTESDGSSDGSSEAPAVGAESAVDEAGADG